LYSGLSGPQKKVGAKITGNYPKYTPKLKVWAKNSLFYQKEGAKYRIKELYSTTSERL
jgi:hypothetical protein